MTGNESYQVDEPYDRENSDTCDYAPPAVSLSVSGNKIIAIISKGSYNISYSLFVDGEEKKDISISSNGIVSGYTLDGTESTIKIMVTDTAGYTAVVEKELTPNT